MFNKIFSEHIKSNNMLTKQINDSQKIVNNFVDDLYKTFSSQDSLLLNFSQPNVLELSIISTVVITNENDFKNYKGYQFDLIIGDLPFGLQTVPIDSVSKLNVSKNWSFMLSALRMLSSTGRAFFLIEPSILFSTRGKAFLSDLAREKHFVNAVFELPEKLLYPQTIFQPIIIGIERHDEEMLFIGEITESYDILLSSYLSKSGTDNLENGLLVQRANFSSFSRYRIESQINNLKTQYKEYNRYELGEVSKDFNQTRGAFEDVPNSIYIPKLGTYHVVSLKRTTIKHQNYFQIVLDEKIVKAEFLELFNRSELGRLILNSLISGSVIPRINLSDLVSSIVAIPNLDEQNLLAQTNQKLLELQNLLDDLKSDLSLNPKNAEILLDKCESVYGSLKLLSIEDQILSLIRKGENKHVEFKQTFSKNLKTGLKDREIEKSSLKTIVGFLNSEGGTLLVGVTDEGHISGIKDDIFTSNDKYKLHFKNAINEKVGTEFATHLDYELVQISQKLILKVDCRPSIMPCFYDDKEFYVRTNPATDKLEGKKQIDYIKAHFK